MIALISDSLCLILYLMIINGVSEIIGTGGVLFLEFV